MKCRNSAEHSSSSSSVNALSLCSWLVMRWPMVSRHYSGRGSRKIVRPRWCMNTGKPCPHKPAGPLPIRAQRLWQLLGIDSCWVTASQSSMSAASWQVEHMPGKPTPPRTFRQHKLGLMDGKAWQSQHKVVWGKEAGMGLERVWRKYIESKHTVENSQRTNKKQDIFKIIISYNNITSF